MNEHLIRMIYEINENRLSENVGEHSLDPILCKCWPQQAPHELYQDHVAMGTCDLQLPSKWDYDTVYHDDHDDSDEDENHHND